MGFAGTTRGLSFSSATPLFGQTRVVPTHTFFLPHFSFARPELMTPHCGVVCVCDGANLSEALSAVSTFILQRLHWPRVMRRGPILCSSWLSIYNSSAEHGMPCMSRRASFQHHATRASRHLHGRDAEAGLQCVHICHLPDYQTPVLWCASCIQRGGVLAASVDATPVGTRHKTLAVCLALASQHAAAACCSCLGLPTRTGRHDGGPYGPAKADQTGRAPHPLHRNHPPAPIRLMS